MRLPRLRIQTATRTYRLYRGRARLPAPRRRPRRRAQAVKTIALQQVGWTSDLTVTYAADRRPHQGGR